MERIDVVGDSPRQRAFTDSADSRLNIEASIPHRQLSGSVRRRPSLAAMASLFTPSSNRSLHKSFRDLSMSPRTTSQTTAGSSIFSEEPRSRPRRPSASLTHLGRNLFSPRSHESSIGDVEEQEDDNCESTSPISRGKWFRKLTNRLKKERTASMGEMDSRLRCEGSQSMSTSAPPYNDKSIYWEYPGGAAARAAAAAQNEAFGSSLFTAQRLLSRSMGPENDSESGIGIEIDDVVEEHETATIMACLDPATVLPMELFEYCLTFLDAASLTQAELVSKTWHQIASSRAMWRTLFTTDIGRARPASSRIPDSRGLGFGSSDPNQEWRKMWKARKALQKRWDDGYAAAIYLEGHTDTVYCVQFDDKKIVTGSRDRTLRIWDMETLECVKVIGTPKTPSNTHSVQALDIPTRGKLPFKTIISPAPQQPLIAEEHDPALTHSGSILCLQFDHEILVTGSSDTTIMIWSIAEGYVPQQRLRKHQAGVLDVCFDKDYIVSCSKDTTICLWNRHTGELLRQLTGHRGPVNAVQLRGELIVSASGDGVAKLWNISSGLCVKEFTSKDRGLACVEFSPDCRFIYAGGNDQSIYQFDATTKQLIRELQGHRNLVRSLHLDQLNNRIVSGSYDHSIQVYDIQTGEMVCEFAGWTTSWMLSAKVDYRRIVATSQDRRVVIADFGLGVQDIDLLKSC